MWKKNSISYLPMHMRTWLNIKIYIVAVHRSNRQHSGEKKEMPQFEKNRYLDHGLNEVSSITLLREA